MHPFRLLFLNLISLFSFQAAGAQIAISGYNHLALSVKDIQESTRFYRDIIGLEPVEVPDNLKAIRSWFKIGPGQELHLLAGRRFPVTNNDPNMAHFALTIADADPVEAYLKTQNLPYLRQQRFDGAWQIYIADPDGYFIELNEPKVNWNNLLNSRDLGGWDTYIGPPFPENGGDRSRLKPIGLNTDPDQVFSLVSEDGEPALRISGQHFGGISTKEEFENYHLQLQFKWGKQKWHPRKNAKMDSGLLYHANGKHGADGGFWMQSQEFQVQQGDCGDYWGVAGAVFTIPSRQVNDSTYVYDPKGTLRIFQDNTPAGRHAVKSPDAEKPTGEWNTLDLYCVGDTAVHVVNGQVVMVLFNSRHLVNGKMAPLTKGKIQIQSEGAEIYYRRIRWRQMEAIPDRFLGKN